MAHLTHFIVVLCLGYSTAFMDPCTFYPRGFIPTNETETVIPTPSCQKGVIDWNYPRGSLDIHFSQEMPFQLCVKDWLGGDAFTIFDNTLGKEILLNILSRENQCIRSHDHKVILDVKAPPSQRYMGGFSFEIKT